jgi:hypothetical protein
VCGAIQDFASGLNLEELADEAGTGGKRRAAVPSAFKAFCDQLGAYGEDQGEHSRGYALLSQANLTEKSGRKMFVLHHFKAGKGTRDCKECRAALQECQPSFGALYDNV